MKGQAKSTHQIQENNKTWKIYPIYIIKSYLLEIMYVMNIHKCMQVTRRKS